MAAPQNFRSAFNGFNREDVVHYLEYMNNKYQNQINQLTSENEELRAQLAQRPDCDQSQRIEELEARCADLAVRLEEAEAAVQAAGDAPQEVPKAAPVPDISEELAAYRRAERIEREARERAELVYFQASGVLGEATGKVDAIAADITDMADQVMSQLTQLQMAVSSSKQALQDASSIMNTIRPNK